MFNTLETYHFKELPQPFKNKAKKMIDDIIPLGILYEGTIDAVEVWGRDDILLLMQAVYNEARKEESKRKDTLLEWAKEKLNEYKQMDEDFQGEVFVGNRQAFAEVIAKIESL